MQQQRNVATKRFINTDLGRAIVGGAVGTIAFSTGLQIAHALGLPAVSVSRLLGEDVLPGDENAYALGAVWHLFNGSVVFPVLHAGLFDMLGLKPSAASGAITGVIHGILTGVGMGALRPRGEDPGFFGIKKGTAVPLLWVGCNALYGAIVGGTYGMAAISAEQRRIVEEVTGTQRKREAA